jgi:hypothetical protein
VLRDCSLGILAVNSSHRLHFSKRITVNQEAESGKHVLVFLKPKCALPPRGFSLVN